MLPTEQRLRRRTQLSHGLVWLAAAQGDPYAALLRGLDTDPRPYWRLLSEERLSRSATGAWVTARHAVARQVAAEPALRALPPVEGVDAPASGTGASEAAHHVEEGWERALASAAREPDLVTLARDGALGTLSRAWGLDSAGERTLRVAVELTGAALDDPFYPQSLAATRGIAEGVAALRSLPEMGRRGEELLAAAGVPMVTSLVVNTLTPHPSADRRPDLPGLWDQLRAEPGRAASAVRETLRWAGPVQLHATVADAACDLAGRRIEEGEQVVVALGAANRDPGVFTHPDRYDPDRPADELSAVLPPGLEWSPVVAFAVAVAEEGLRRLTAGGGGAAPAGPVVRRAAAPVSWAPAVRLSETI
ncbi:Cytochrome P450 like protein [Streptomyces albidoflavus]|uniref:cytochrome P450 family protein n=1 Tax=Streptomyces TaxID=1883 RepID=UPI0001AEEDEA|nr:cytochrome P450 [Streptomyces albidoflavus]AGI87004.1 Cytochrome P450 like protein [Streptomyces albidoflavus]QLP90775.1 Cytochrome P450 like protein [Streptomyces albidoflavus]BDH49612.1 hypothetical protein MTP02_06230 [Streptomyces albus]